VAHLCLLIPLGLFIHLLKPEETSKEKEAAKPAAKKISEGNTLTVSGIDMIDGTPILDIKPYTRSDMKKKASFGWLPKTKNTEEDYD